MEIVFVSSRSITLELDNDSAYFSSEYEIFLNGAFYKKSNRNVETIYDLKPNTEYIVKVFDKEVSVRTKNETVCLHTNMFNPTKDGKTDDTLKIQAAIMACPKDGCLYIDAGLYLVTTLFLKSDMTIYIDKNAKIIGEYDRNKFPVLPGLIHGDEELNLGTWEGAEVDEFASIITGINVQNVNIIGEGEIDCRAELGDWYKNHREIRIACRPFGLFLNRSTNINVVGLFIHNTPAWNVHPYFSKKLKFINMRIENPVNMPTTDGLDPDCCDDVLILGNYFNVGDDCIAIKSGTIDLAKKYLQPCKNITIRNCFMEAGHGGVVFGSESSGGIENVVVTKCLFKNTDRGLRIKTRRGRGRYGIIDNIVFKNIVMDGVMTPFVINMFYNMGPAGGHEEYVWSKEKQPVDERTPYIGKFDFEDMKCNNVKLAASVFLGLPEEPIKEVKFKNVTFNYDLNAQPDYPVMIEHKEKMVRCGIYCENVDSLILENVKFNGQIGEEVIGYDFNK